MHNLPVWVHGCGQVAQPLISATIMSAQVSAKVVNADRGHPRARGSRAGSRAAR